MHSIQHAFHEQTSSPSFFISPAVLSVMSIQFSLSLALFAMMSTSLSFATSHVDDGAPAVVDVAAHASHAACDRSCDHDGDADDEDEELDALLAADDPIALPTEAPSCDGLLLKGFYFGEKAPLASVEVNVYGEDRMSMTMFLHLKKPVLYQARALEFVFDKLKCVMSVTGGSGTWRQFGGDSGSFANPDEMVARLRPDIPKGAPVNLDGGLNVVVEAKELVILGVFGLKPSYGPQHWETILVKNGQDRKWKLTPAEMEQVRKYPALMLPPIAGVVEIVPVEAASAKGVAGLWSIGLGLLLVPILL